MAELRFFSAEDTAAKALGFRDIFVLTPESWDDYGHELRFRLSYCDHSGRTLGLGRLKILKLIRADDPKAGVERKTPLDAEFSKLSSAYISLGQSDEFYLNVRELGSERAADLLSALRDIAWSPLFAQDFEPLSAFRNGLVRSNPAKRARRLGARLVTDGEVYEEPSFVYLHEPHDEALLEIEFPFDPHDQLPGRIVGIIGRNAVGKTTFMARLAEDLAQTARISAERERLQRRRFSSRVPLFTRVLTVSYSAFDRFKRPKPEAGSSYVYCGIRDDKGQLSQRGLRDAFDRNKVRVRELQREHQWIDAIMTILGEVDDEDLRPRLEREILQPSVEESVFDELSSGQGILCHVVTGLLAWLQPNSVVLFDEPETHLHPNAVANLFHVLSGILKVTDSVAILATHSPVVIQEIPAKRVLWFRRDAAGLRVGPLELESFGESVSELTRHVFETAEVDHLYKSVLARLAEKEPLEAVLARFEKGLSMNAQAFLLAQYPPEALR